MARAQPLKALGLVLENFFKPDAGSERDTIAFLNAALAPDMSPALETILHFAICQQSARPQFLDLKNNAVNVHPTLPQNAQNMGITIILANKFRALNEAMIQQARQITRDDGTIIVVGEKMAGIASIKKRLSKEFSNIETVSKYHSQVFWLANNNPVPETEIGPTVHNFVSNGKPFKTGAGLFCAKKIDPGSAMLEKYFDNITGEVADLGAGWGYLSWALCKRGNKITRLDLFESEFHAVEASKDNLAEFTNDTVLRYFWQDICREPINDKYDWVIMNPPFHLDLDYRLDLGQTFIQTTAKILKPSGKLLMVANQQLAYENLVSRIFSSHKVLQQQNGYKIILARK